MKRQNKAFALPLVLILLVVSLIFGSTLFRSGSSINQVNDKIYAEKYLEWQNRGILELVKYKLKILPSEFYIAQDAFVGNSNELMLAFLDDFNGAEAEYPDIYKFDPDTVLGQSDDTTKFLFTAGAGGTPPMTLTLQSSKGMEYYKEDVYKVNFSTFFTYRGKDYTRPSESLVYVKRRSS